MKRKRLYSAFSAGSVPLILICGLIFAAVGDGNSPRSGEPVSAARGGELKRIDGDRNGREVVFPHTRHALIVTKDGGNCMTCHHLSHPAGDPPPCSRCHSSMYHASSIFDHELHAELFKTDTYCGECHGPDRSRERVKRCDACHGEYSRPVIYYTSARGYKHAMHGSCLGCHQKEDKRRGRVMLAKCGFCHQDMNKSH